MIDSKSLGCVLFEELGLPAQSDFAVAYSGGCDSHVLLHILSGLRQKIDFNLTALHFDHGLLPQSTAWASQCGAVCRQWNIRFISDRRVVAKHPGESIEASARRSRYQWFEQVIQGGQVLLTAHHANDQAETVLMNLLRGGGVELLAGIPQKRRLSMAKSNLVLRPLLSFCRNELIAYAQLHELSWIEDPSNQSEEFDRNYIRASIIPRLEQRWPGVVGSLGRNAENCRQATRFIEQALQPILKRSQAPDKRGVFCLAPPLDAKAMKQLGRFQVINLIRCWLHQNGHSSPSSGQLTTLFKQVFEVESKSACVSWNQSQIHYFNGHLYLTKRLGDVAGEIVDWDMQQCELGINGLCLEIHRGINNELNADRFQGKSVSLVWRKGGERITLPGRKHSSELKKLFQKKAIPTWERNALPLLVVDGEVAWVHGVGASAAYCCDRNKQGINLRFVTSY